MSVSFICICSTYDLLIGGMDEDSFTRKQLSSSIPYYQDDQTWCVAVAKADELWRSFFHLFSLKEWALVVAMVLLIAVILYVVSRIDGRNESMSWMLLSSLSICLGLSTVFEPQRTTVRFMFVSFLFYGLIFSSAFHSFLVAVLTNPRDKEQINSVESAVAHGFQFGGGLLPLSHYADGRDELSVRVRAAYTACDDPDACLATLRRRDDFAVSVSRKHAASNPVIDAHELFCFERTHNVYGFSVTMLAQRNFHLLGRMNSIIRRALEFGLIQKWEHDDAAKKPVIAAQKHGHGEGLVVLRVDNIMGALILMAAGYALAMLAFVIEVAVNVQWVRRRAHGLWRCVDAVLNGRRMCWSGTAGAEKRMYGGVERVAADTHNE